MRIVEGDLIKIERQQQIEKMEQADLEKKVKRLEEGSCQTLDDWIALAKQRNYKFPQAWATRRYELRCKRRA